jgi:hypothetical protein
VVGFDETNYVFGGLAVTQLESEPALFVDSGEGPYLECTEVACADTPSGIGVVGTYVEGSSRNLATAFFDDRLGGLRFVAFDADNRLGNEIDGQETFLGPGVWLADDGSQLEVVVALVRVPEDASGAAQRLAPRVLRYRAALGAEMPTFDLETFR